MTAEQYRYPYLDSSVFIAWLKGEVVRGVDRKEVADHILVRYAGTATSSYLGTTHSPPSVILR